MAKVGAQRAGELTGRSKSTIQRAMNAGKLSYEVDENGRRVIDVSELERVFGLSGNGAPSGKAGRDNQQDAADVVKAELERAQSMLEMERLRMRVRMLEDQLFVTNQHVEDVKGQRDEWQKQAQQVLLTSQYSQKQAEDLKIQLAERDRRDEALRQKRLAERMEQMQARNTNQNANGPRTATVQGQPVPPQGQRPQQQGQGQRPAGQQQRPAGQQQRPQHPAAQSAKTASKTAKGVPDTRTFLEKLFGTK
jgi:hypothetical protein